MARFRSLLVFAVAFAPAAARAQSEPVCPPEKPKDGLSQLITQLPAEKPAMCGSVPFVTRDTPLAAPVEGLAASGDLPLPSRGPDADGFFHPAPGYAEGGTFARPASKPEWELGKKKAAPQAAPGHLRVVEWNVERGNQLDKSIRVMKEINADLWIISESDLYGKNSGNVVVAREIARALGYSYYTSTEFNELLPDRRGSSGNAIISRYPLHDGATRPIPIDKEHGGSDWADSKAEPRCGQRNALNARIDVPAAGGGTTTVNIIGLHTENKSNREVRKRQFDDVRGAMAVPGEPTIIAGDLNTVGVNEGPQFRDFLAKDLKEKGPANGLFDCSRGDDNTTWGLKVLVYMRIDWVLMQAGEKNSLGCAPGSYSVVGNDGSSDHFPVVTDFTVR